MAKPQSTTGARARKNRRTGHPSGPPVGVPNHPIPSLALPDFAENTDTNSDAGPRSLEQAIEIERGRLTHAQSILGCLHTALLSAEEKNRHEPGCADVAAIALKLVREAVHRLDYIYLQPFTEALRRTGSAPARRRAANARR